MTVETTGAAVYLHGDPCPLITSLSTEQVLSNLTEFHDLQDSKDLLCWAFLRLPHPDCGDALVRPDAIVAITGLDRVEDEDE